MEKKNEVIDGHQAVARTWYTILELAKAMKVSSDAVYNWCKRRKIDAEKDVDNDKWRVPASEYHRLLTCGSLFKTVTVCPYCFCSLIIDAATGKHVFNPHGRKHDPCPHLACVWTTLDVARQRPNGEWCYDDARSVNWIWEIGKGLHELNTRESAEDNLLTGFLCAYGFDDLPLDLMPETDHEIVGDSASFREGNLPGSGEEFIIGRDGDDVLDGSVDGWGVFADEPDRVMREIWRIRWRGVY
jgi:hypothetical protein